ncbi:hypothetical protein CPB83DRAFT_882911 [Crepidotus variabilis]|uniref:Uncharacterized protein n=1 Tax=Crepidotus variabilis TaxID=179855 RepID=A0A9P6EIG9_9AGAR|nr:hypothetical protein CPB83DRAFT_882911 [Crepidotus variabilis]
MTQPSIPLSQAQSPASASKLGPSTASSSSSSRFPEPKPKPNSKRTKNKHGDSSNSEGLSSSDSDSDSNTLNEPPRTRGLDRFKFDAPPSIGVRIFREPVSGSGSDEDSDDDNEEEEERKEEEDAEPNVMPLSRKLLAVSFVSVSVSVSVSVLIPTPSPILLSPAKYTYSHPDASPEIEGMDHRSFNPVLSCYPPHQDGHDLLRRTIRLASPNPFLFLPLMPHLPLVGTILVLFKSTAQSKHNSPERAFSQTLDSTSEWQVLFKFNPQRTPNLYVHFHNSTLLIGGFSESFGIGGELSLPGYTGERKKPTVTKTKRMA